MMVQLKERFRRFMANEVLKFIGKIQSNSQWSYVLALTSTLYASEGGGSTGMDT